MKKTLEQIFTEIRADKDFSDLSDDEIMEMAKMEVGTQEIKNYESTGPKKSEKPRTVKTSDEKITLFQSILNSLTTEYGENVEILKENKLISVKIDEKIFKIDIIEQRKPKK